MHTILNPNITNIGIKTLLTANLIKVDFKLKKKIIMIIKKCDYLQAFLKII